MWIRCYRATKQEGNITREKAWTDSWMIMKILTMEKRAEDIEVCMYSGTEMWKHMSCQRRAKFACDWHPECRTRRGKILAAEAGKRTVLPSFLPSFFPSFLPPSLLHSLSLSFLFFSSRKKDKNKHCGVFRNCGRIWLTEIKGKSGFPRERLLVKC